MKRISIIMCSAALLWGCTQQQHEQPGGRRIVSFTPAITEILYELAADDIVVGVSDFCTYPPHVRSKQKVGGLFNPNLEVLLRLKPTDIFLQGNIETVRSFCRKNGVNMHTVTLENLDTITNGIQQIGNALGRAAAAETLRRNIDGQWQDMIAASRSHTTIPVFICIGREPGPVASCSTANTGSFLSEALDAAGGSNICSDVVGHYPTISAEVLNMRNPSVILDLQPGRTFSRREYAVRLHEWDTLSSVNAIKNGRVILLTNDCILVPGPRITEIAGLFSAAITNQPVSGDGTDE
jgi:iron complex transport system substrate-binding protein